VLVVETQYNALRKMQKKKKNNCNGYALLGRNSVEFVDGMNTNVSEEGTAFIFRIE
jgi:hypothetical protein